MIKSNIKANYHSKKPQQKYALLSSFASNRIFDRRSYQNSCLNRSLPISTRQCTYSTHLPKATTSEINPQHRAITLRKNKTAQETHADIAGKPAVSPKPLRVVGARQNDAPGRVFRFPGDVGRRLDADGLGDAVALLEPGERLRRLLHPRGLRGRGGLQRRGHARRLGRRAGGLRRRRRARQGYWKSAGFRDQWAEFRPFAGLHTDEKSFEFEVNPYGEFECLYRKEWARIRFLGGMFWNLFYVKKLIVFGILIIMVSDD